jgi:2-alkyl-3-oxoalkanoate reductase
VNLVIGASGCLGAAVAQALRDRGLAVRGLDLRPGVVAGVDARVGDMGDRGVLDAALQGVETVYQCAALVSLNPRYLPEMQRVNVEANRRVLARSAAAGVRAFVYASTQVLCGEPGEELRGIDESVPYARRPLSAFAATRITSERDVLAADDPSQGFRTISLRVPSMFGAHDRFHLPLHLGLSERGLAMRVGAQKRCAHVYAENAAHAHLLAAAALREGRCGGRAFYLSDDALPCSYWDTMSDLLVACGRPPMRHGLSRRAVAALTHVSEAIHPRVPWLLRGEPAFSYEALTVAAGDCWFDTTALCDELGFAPLVPRDEAIRRTARWFAENPRPRPFLQQRLDREMPRP